MNDCFIDDLKIIINVINIILENERYNYNIIFNEIKMRLFLYVKKFIFRDLFIKVSLFVLKKMLFKYLKVINHNMKSCIRYFITIMKLSCAHMIKQRILEKIEILKIEDIHFH